MTEFKCSIDGLGEFVQTCSKCDKQRPVIRAMGSADLAINFCSKRCFKKSPKLIAKFRKLAKCKLCKNKPADPKYDLTINFPKIRNESPEGLAHPSTRGVLITSAHCSLECNEKYRREMQVHTDDNIKFTAKCTCGKEMETLNKDHKKCARCKTKLYCSRECQVQDWPSHKKECKES